MKKLIALAAIFLMSSVSYADSGRETLSNPPQEIEMMSEYSDNETWAFRVKDSSENVVYEILSDGQPGKSLQRREYTPTCVSASGYSITAANIRDYSVFYIDTSPSVAVVNPMSTGNAGIGVSAGVTVTLAVPTAVCDKKDFYLINADSGGTDFVAYVPGGTMSGGTAIGFSANRTVGLANVSSCTDFLTMDGYYDVLHLRANYNSAVSYEVLDYYAH